MSLAGIGTNAAGNRLTVGATNIAPGDTIQRAVTLTNTGTLDLANVVLTTNAATSSLLDTDPTNGLQVTIQKCSVAWTESAFPYTYTCGGTTSTVLASTPVIGTNWPLSNLALTAAGGEQPAGDAHAAGGGGRRVPGPELGGRLHLHRHAAHRHRHRSGGHLVERTPADAGDRDGGVATCW